MRSIFLSPAQTLHISIVVFQELLKERTRACRYHGNGELRSRRPSSFGSLDNFQSLYILYENSFLILFSFFFFIYFLKGKKKKTIETTLPYIFPFLKSLRHQCRVTHLIRIQRKCTRKPRTCLSRVSRFSVRPTSLAAAAVQIPEGYQRVTTSGGQQTTAAAAALTHDEDQAVDRSVMKLKDAKFLMSSSTEEANSLVPAGCCVETEVG